MTTFSPPPAPRYPPSRPRLRGWLHQAAFWLSLAGLAVLVRGADSTLALVAGLVYGCATAALYLVSFSYHVLARGRRARRIMQRADHSMIFVLIAGSFTPAVLLALHGPWRWALLGAVWAIASGGIALKCLALERFPRLGGGLYIAFGWVGVLAAPAFLHRPLVGLLFLLGGITYTVGAALFARGRPRLNPRWFGYHEAWHTFVVAAGALIFVGNFMLLHSA
ncbi:MAG TPA: hemolysin III family protein [Acidimicrobiia bacterium]|nr:hemolysin III family protein [Acidimicrobiia bacterium]